MNPRLRPRRVKEDRPRKAREGRFDALFPALPMGARLRLKASTDVTAHPAYVQGIFQAMKTYGLIVADNGTDRYVAGADDTRGDNDLLNPAFASLTAWDFDVNGYFE